MKIYQVTGKKNGRDFIMNILTDENDKINSILDSTLLNTDIENGDNINDIGDNLKCINFNISLELDVDMSLENIKNTYPEYFA